MLSEKINEIARKFLLLKEKSKSGKEEDIREYKDYQNFCASKLASLVTFRCSRYKRFPNYEDLKQDGFEALMAAFETYDPSKGDFKYWASQYINTRISRSANAHSTIRFPLKKAKDLQPHKVSQVPIMKDTASSPLEEVEQKERISVVQKAISELPKDQQEIILMYYDFIGKDSSVSKISKKLKISRPTCQKLLNEAQVSLKNSLKSHFNESSL